MKHLRTIGQKLNTGMMKKAFLAFIIVLTGLLSSCTVSRRGYDNDDRYYRGDQDGYYQREGDIGHIHHSRRWHRLHDRDYDENHHHTEIEIGR